MLETVSLQAFNFQSKQVRTLSIDDEPWFVATDVLSAISLDRKALERLDDDEKGVNSIHTLGGPQDVTIINESGLYSLILTSRKPQAKEFKRWITHEVLPSLRKTGQYALPPEPPDTPDWSKYIALAELMADATPAPGQPVSPLEEIILPILTVACRQLWGGITDAIGADDDRQKWRALSAMLRAVGEPPPGQVSFDEAHHRFVMAMTDLARHPQASPEMRDFALSLGKRILQTS